VKKKLFCLISLWAFLCILARVSALAQTANGCTPFIRQKDTTICPGTSVALNLIPPSSTDSLLPGIWRLLIPGSAIDSNLFNIKPFGFDKVRQCFYSIIHNRIIRYDLTTQTLVTVPAANWPGDFTEFVYDYTNRRLLLWRGGRDSVYAIPDTGGSWTAIGAGSIDRESNGSSAYWNPINQQPGFYGGYGFNQTKSWVFENNGTGWLQRKNNPAIDSTPPKGGNLMGMNKTGNLLYLFSGQGNYSGDELSGSCTLGSPWATANGMYCWLRDLWEFDLTSYQFQKVLPVNSASIQYDGALGYDYEVNRFYLFGGYQPTASYAANQNLTNTPQTFYFRKNKDSGFVVFQGEGDRPAAMPHTLLHNYTYYDEKAKRLIWARFDGVWAYYPDTTLVPQNGPSVLWSTGDTGSAITVKPLQTTRYTVSRTQGSLFCQDSVLLKVVPMQTRLSKFVTACSDSLQLDAGSGFDKYVWSTGDTTQTLLVKQNGIYTVSVQKNVCTLQDTTQVSLATPVLPFQLGVIKDSICTGEYDSLFIKQPQTGIQYNWLLSGSAAILHTGIFYAPPNLSGNSVFVVNGVSNPSICPAATATASIFVRTQLSPPTLHLDSAGLYSLAFHWDPVPGATGYLVSTDSGRTYQIPQSGPSGLIHVITGLQPNETRAIQVKTTGNYACQESDAAILDATTRNPFGDGIYIPNAFTPNGDGVNDLFRVYGTAFAKTRIRIFNQWGKLLYSTTDLTKGWDGSYQGKPQPGGLYTYALDAEMQDGKVFTKGGSFQLIR
jgi:gliding motility-associated-like protein